VVSNYRLVWRFFATGKKEIEAFSSEESLQAQIPPGFGIGKNYNTRKLTPFVCLSSPFLPLNL